MKVIEFKEYQDLVRIKKAQDGAGDENNDHGRIRGLEILNSIPREDADAISSFFMAYTIMELRMGLGLTDHEDVDIENLGIFNKIADIYEEAAGDCYFCSEKVDPNADEFGPHTKLCLMCKLKLANFTEALGIKASRVFQGMGPRPQQSRLKLEDQ